ncbi:MAG: FliA/WhiG family RNA polymerase sigma factor [Candidatus Eremiobacterota bacterium]
MAAAADMDRVVAENQGLVRHIARKLVGRLPHTVELDDLIHDGMVGLMDAYNRFDPSRGIKFQTFASSRIRGSMLDSLRSQDWVSRGGRRRVRDVQQAEESLRHRLGRQPSRDEVSRQLGVTRAELDRRTGAGSDSFLLSLDDVREGQESALNNLADPGADVEASVLRQDRKAVLLRALKGLSRREQLVLGLYYFEDFSIHDIASVLSVSEARVSQLHRRALGRLREALLGLT